MLANAPVSCFVVFGTDNKSQRCSIWIEVHSKERTVVKNICNTRLLKEICINSVLPMSSNKFLNNYPWYLVDFRDSKAEYEVCFLQGSKINVF